jgi:hypothetical protein
MVEMVLGIVIANLIKMFIMEVTTALLIARILNAEKVKEIIDIFFSFIRMTHIGIMKSII